jgi:hypothetical protein
VSVGEEVEEEVGEFEEEEEEEEEEEAPVDVNSLAKLSRRTVRVRPGAQLVDGACVRRRVVPASLLSPPPVLSPRPPALSGTKVTTREWRRETDAATLWQEPAQHALPHI